MREVAPSSILLKTCLELVPVHLMATTIALVCFLSFGLGIKSAIARDSGSGINVDSATASTASDQEFYDVSNMSDCLVLAEIPPAVQQLSSREYASFLKTLVSAVGGEKGSQARTCLNKLYRISSELYENVPHGLGQRVLGIVPRGLGSGVLGVAALAAAIHLDMECDRLDLLAGELKEGCVAIKASAEGLLARIAIALEGPNPCAGLKPIMKEANYLKDSKIPNQIQRINKALEEDTWNRQARVVTMVAGGVSAIWGVTAGLRHTCAMVGSITGVTAILVAGRGFVFTDAKQKLLDAKKICVDAHNMITGELLTELKNALARLSCIY